nr:MAG TPA: hypothetical protein [Caudoviricetes sp.]
MISQVFRCTTGGGKNDPSPPKSEMCPRVLLHTYFFSFSPKSIVSLTFN